MSDFPKAVLAIDCALGGCLVAVKTGAQGRVFSQTYVTEREQAARLVPMVQDVMREAGVSFGDVELVVTTTGPGSFTGLRIGLSTARAFGMARDIPVQGVGTLECMMRSCRLPQDSADILVILETKRTDFYAAAYDREGRAMLDSCCMGAEDIADFIKGSAFILCGDAAVRLTSAIGSQGFGDIRERTMLDPEKFLECGIAQFMAAGGVAIKPEPVYLRGADVSISNKARREIKEIP